MDFVVETHASRTWRHVFLWNPVGVFLVTSIVAIVRKTIHILLLIVVIMNINLLVMTIVLHIVSII